VVGGGNSAAEATLSLAEAGAKTTLAIRRRSLTARPDEASSASPIKPWVLEPLERAAAQGFIRILTESTVTGIDSQKAFLRIGLNGDERAEAIRCDHIFALIGADPDTGLLQSVGAAIAADGRPIYDRDSYETTIPRLYVSGHLTRERHIKNAVEISRRVVAHIAARLSMLSCRETSLACLVESHAGS
jgi:thioredoxin reductase (NADPH)